MMPNPRPLRLPRMKEREGRQSRGEAPLPYRDLRQDRRRKAEANLSAALRHFAEKGFNGTSINALAREAGISIGSLYSYFPSKEDLFLSLVAQGQDSLARPCPTSTSRPASSIRIPPSSSAPATTPSRIPSSTSSTSTPRRRASAICRPACGSSSRSRSSSTRRPSPRRRGEASSAPTYRSEQPPSAWTTSSSSSSSPSPPTTIATVSGSPRPRRGREGRRGRPHRRHTRFRQASLGRALRLSRIRAPAEYHLERNDRAERGRATHRKTRSGGRRTRLPGWQSRVRSLRPPRRASAREDRRGQARLRPCRDRSIPRAEPPQGRAALRDLRPMRGLQSPAPRVLEPGRGEVAHRRGCFARTAKLATGAIPTHPSPPFAYRNRMQLHFTKDERVGLVRRSSSEIVETPGCPIALKSIQGWIEAHAGTRRAYEELNGSALAKDHFLVFGYGDEIWIEGKQDIVEARVAGQGIRFHLRGFFQSNLSLLDSFVREAVAGLSGERAADLYCGVGLFGRFAPSFQSVTCVKENADALELAKSGVPGKRRQILPHDRRGLAALRIGRGALRPRPHGPAADGSGPGSARVARARQAENDRLPLLRSGHPRQGFGRARPLGLTSFRESGPRLLSPDEPCGVQCALALR